MSEKITHHAEHNENHNIKSEQPERLMLPTALEAEPLRTGESDPAESLKQARAKISETTKSEAGQPNPIENLAAEDEASQNSQPRRINRELKQITLQRELKQIQRKLPLPERGLSRIIHQPVIRVISDGAGQTVSRPSGLLGGGILAFIGTTTYLYMARHIGFEYNYLVFLMLLICGFTMGILAELAVHLAFSSRRRPE
ncbi:MAG TPA: hypothetical protein VLF79_02295 [Candidatus Saccharimonadales bacterium]|nr:hypothetical protein [Candidatus Saccharimonadales bacterium]